MPADPFTTPVSASRPVVVTGAGGFIGSHLTTLLLERGYRVRALVHYNALGSRGHLEEVPRLGAQGSAEGARDGRLEVVFGDIQDARCVQELIEGAGVVFHLAALIGIPYSYVAPESYVNVNVRGTLNVLEACRRAGNGIRLIHTSTSEALGTARVTPQNEDHPLQAQSPYAATKIAADKLAEAYHLSFGVPVVIVRPFNTFGPRQSARAIVPTILCQALSGNCSSIRLGALDPVRDLTYVADTARAFVAVAEAPAERVVGRLFHVGSGTGVSIGDLAREILDVLECDKPIVSTDQRIRPAASEVRHLICDATRIREAVGWKPEISRREGLRRAAAWVREHLDLFRPDEYSL